MPQIMEQYNSSLKEALFDPWIPLTGLVLVVAIFHQVQKFSSPFGKTTKGQEKAKEKAKALARLQKERAVLERDSNKSVCSKTYNAVAQRVRSIHNKVPSLNTVQDFGARMYKTARDTPKMYWSTKKIAEKEVGLSCSNIEEDEKVSLQHITTSNSSELSQSAKKNAKNKRRRKGSKKRVVSRAVSEPVSEFLNQCQSQPQALVTPVIESANVEEPSADNLPNKLTPKKYINEYFLPVSKQPSTAILPLQSSPEKQCPAEAVPEIALNRPFLDRRTAKTMIERIEEQLNHSKAMMEQMGYASLPRGFNNISSCESSVAPSENEDESGNDEEASIAGNDGAGNEESFVVEGPIASEDAVKVDSSEDKEGSGDATDERTSDDGGSNDDSERDNHNDDIDVEQLASHDDCEQSSSAQVQREAVKDVHLGFEDDSRQSISEQVTREDAVNDSEQLVMEETAAHDKTSNLDDSSEQRHKEDIAGNKHSEFNDEHGFDAQSESGSTCSSSSASVTFILDHNVPQTGFVIQAGGQGDREAGAGEPVSDASSWRAFEAELEYSDYDDRTVGGLYAIVNYEFNRSSPDLSSLFADDSSRPSSPDTVASAPPGISRRQYRAGKEDKQKMRYPSSVRSTEEIVWYDPFQPRDAPVNRVEPLARRARSQWEMGRSL
ncbi:hypothetical protein B0O99DRAFT_592909 [Bisporella sp. PMI_857]|nr:hypothetical protein B0O99DRAFT_592909 [Bisporella sp. PMI_857]